MGLYGRQPGPRQQPGQPLVFWLLAAFNLTMWLVVIPSELLQ